MYPALHHPVAGRGSGRGLCLVANRDPKRDTHLRALLVAGLRPRVYGNYFLRHPLALRHPGCFRPRVANERLCDVYARHAVSLNIHARVVREGTNMRSFECAGCGIPQLVEYRPDLKRHFEPGVELEVYRDPGEAADRRAVFVHLVADALVVARDSRPRALGEHRA